MKSLCFKIRRLALTLLPAFAACLLFWGSALAREGHPLIGEAFELILDNYVSELSAGAVAGAAINGMQEHLKEAGKATAPPPDLSIITQNIDRKRAAELVGTAIDGLSKEAGVPAGELEEAAIRGVFKTLDPHSAYLDHQGYNDLISETKGEFVGVGMQLTLKDGVLTVITAIEDAPAYKAGLKAGDRIISIDGTPAKGMSVPEAVKRIRGRKGTVVLLLVQRGAGPLIEFRLTREHIKIKSVKYRFLEPGIGYLRISQFQEDTFAEAQAALKKLGRGDSSLKGLVLDLRNNPGGLLSTAADVANEFMGSGTIVYLKGRNAESNIRFEAGPDGVKTVRQDDAGGQSPGREAMATRPYYPLAVLVNEGSASAAEVVSGALKDVNRGVLFGAKTFGKGSVQTLYQLSSGGMRLTTAEYRFASGRALNGGLIPDVSVQEKEGADEPLEAARRAVNLVLQKGDYASNDALRTAAQKNAAKQQDN